MIQSDLLLANVIFWFLNLSLCLCLSPFSRWFPISSLWDSVVLLGSMSYVLLILNLISPHFLLGFFFSFRRKKTQSKGPKAHQIQSHTLRSVTIKRATLSERERESEHGTLFTEKMKRRNTIGSSAQVQIKSPFVRVSGEWGCGVEYVDSGG